MREEKETKEWRTKRQIESSPPTRFSLKKSTEVEEGVVKVRGGVKRMKDAY